MKVQDLIKVLEYLESQNGNVDVHISSNKYLISANKIEKVIEDNGKIKIIVTK